VRDASTLTAFNHPEPFSMQSLSTALQRHTAQQDEYRAMITALRAVLDASTPLESYYLAPQAHSRLGAAQNQAQNMLQTLFENSGEPQLTAYLQTSRGSLLQVDATADQCNFSFNRRDGSVDRYVIESVSRLQQRSSVSASVAEYRRTPAFRQAAAAVTTAA
jgi:hypothetical protein